MLTQLEFEKKAADERVKLAEMYDSTLEERAKEQSAELSKAREKESQHRATAAQMRFWAVFVIILATYFQSFSSATRGGRKQGKTDKLCSPRNQLLPRNMDVFRHLDSLVLWHIFRSDVCHCYTGFRVNCHLRHCVLFCINFTASVLCGCSRGSIVVVFMLILWAHIHGKLG